MKILIRPFLFFLSLFVANAGFAQGEVPEFTVQVGNFVGPQPGDFAHLQNLGFVYSTKRSSGHTDVFLGGFTSETAAQKVAGDLKSKGYENAFVSKLNTEGGQSTTVIQLATKNAGEKLDWEKYHAAAPLFVLLNGKQVKILAGGFADLAAANAKLPELKKLGFNDAFAKNVNNALLHEVADFEMGGAIKKELIPFDLTKEDPAIAAKKAEPKPTSYDETAGPAVAEKSQLVAKGVEPAATTAAAEKPAAKKEETPAAKKTETPPAVKAAPATFSFKAKMPEIRANVKRTSAIELQKALKAEGTYKGPLDGFYGKGTRTAYEQAVTSNRQLQKYRILSNYQALPDLDANANALQSNINRLWDDPRSALDGLEKSKAAAAKAYRAYHLFVSDGPSRDVNQLMNEAIDEAYRTWTAGRAPHIDPSITYSYESLDQLLSHMGHIHEVSKENPAVPCWMFSRHPGTALKAFGNNTGAQACGGFWEWEEIRILNAIAADLGAPAKTTAPQSDLAQLYLNPKTQGWAERKALLEWNEKAWIGIEGWSTRDPMLAEIGSALKMSYCQAQVLLEDFYMDEGFDENVSKGLALAALKTLVGQHFERFM